MNGWISSVLPFVAVGALVLCIWLFMLAGSRAAAEVPKQQKNEYQDDPPRYWALLGWLGHATTFWVTPLVSPTPAVTRYEARRMTSTTSLRWSKSRRAPRPGES